MSNAYLKIYPKITQPYNFEESAIGSSGHCECFEGGIRPLFEETGHADFNPPGSVKGIAAYVPLGVIGAASLCRSQAATSYEECLEALHLS